MHAALPTLPAQDPAPSFLQAAVTAAGASRRSGREEGPAGDGLHLVPLGFLSSFNTEFRPCLMLRHGTLVSSRGVKGFSGLL